MKKVGIGILLLVVSISLLSPDFIKIGVIDYDYVLSQYTVPLVDIKRQVFQDEWKVKSSKLKEEIDVLTQKLQNPSLTQEERSKLETQKNEKYQMGIEQQNYYRKLDEDLKNNRDKYIKEELDYAIRKVAEKKGYAIILDSKLKEILFYGDHIDLTKDAISYLSTMILKFLSDHKIDPSKYGLDPNLLNQINP